MNTLDANGFFHWAILISFANLSIALLLTFIRLAIGPTLPDRVMSLDMIAVLCAATIALYTISENEPVYLDVAITLALIAFLSTVAFARYVQQKGQKGNLR